MKLEECAGHQSKLLVTHGRSPCSVEKQQALQEMIYFGFTTRVLYVLLVHDVARNAKHRIEVNRWAPLSNIPSLFSSLGNIEYIK